MTCQHFDPVGSNGAGVPGFTPADIDLHDHRTDEHGSYGTFSHCIMHPRGIMCRNTNRCRPEDCDRAMKFKKLGLKGVDYGKK